MKKILLFSMLLILTTSACSASSAAVATAVIQTQGAFTKVPTQTDYPTYTPPPTVFVTKLVTKIVIVTPTFTRTPRFTPTITNTSAPTSTLTPTADLLKKSRGDGFYLINIDIAPGVWRSTGKGSSCYWKISTSTGDIIDNHFGMSGGTAYIPSSGFQVQFEGCGIWEYIAAE